jgi:hypothetical protein
MPNIEPAVPARIDECVPVSAVEVEPDVEINPAVAAESINEPIDSSAPIADPAISQPADLADAGMPSHCDPDAARDNPGLPNEPTAVTSRDPNSELTNEPDALTSPHLNPDLTNEPNALIRPHQGGGRKRIESVTHRGDWGKKPRTGPNNRRERSQRRAISQKTERDITWLLAPHNRVTWKPQ